MPNNIKSLMLETIFKTNGFAFNKINDPQILENKNKFLEMFISFLPKDIIEKIDNEREKHKKINKENNNQINNDFEERNILVTIEDKKENIIKNSIFIDDSKSEKSKNQQFNYEIKTENKYKIKNEFKNKNQNENENLNLNSNKNLIKQLENELNNELEFDSKFLRYENHLKFLKKKEDYYKNRYIIFKKKLTRLEKLVYKKNEYSIDNKFKNDVNIKISKKNFSVFNQ